MFYNKIILPSQLHVSFAAVQKTLKKPEINESVLTGF